MVVTPLLECVAYRFLFLSGTVGRNLKLRTHLSLVPLQRMPESKFYSTLIEYDIKFIVTLRKCGLHQFQSEILEDYPSFPTAISLLKPPGNFMYLRFYTSTKYEYYIRACSCVSYHSSNREKIFHNTGIARSLT